jgi:hypothetical protein
VVALTVTGYLVTTQTDKHFPFWSSVAAYSNWLDCKPSRNDPNRTTWYVMVATEDDHFIASATALGVTVERLIGAGADERHELVVGEPGTGCGSVTRFDRPEPGGFGYIRAYYEVPAKRGMRVLADGRPGVITGSAGHYIRVRHDGEKTSRAWHPTWHMDYLDGEGTRG